MPVAIAVPIVIAVAMSCPLKEGKTYKIELLAKVLSLLCAICTKIAERSPPNIPCIP